ncbi:MAG: CPBP family intramembrane metalloprotease [Candidatus Omnitrophica bacterium]|nr:CPBP family intramembrane metalloprotease [Candidatus Omnitrophota bacterium]
MKALFLEILNLFRKEKIYFFLLVAVLCFYSAIFFAHNKALQKEQVPSQNMQRMELLLREVPQTPEIIEKRLENRPSLRWTIQIFSLFFISCFMVGMWFGSSDLKRLFSRQELIPSSGRILSINWGISDVLKVMILFFVTGLSLNLGLALLKLLLAHSKFLSSNLILVHTLLLDLIVIFFIALIVRKKGSTLQDVFGFSFKRIPFREVGWGMRTYCVILPIFIGILALLVLIATRLAYQPPPHPLVEVLLKEKVLSPWTLVASIMVACVVGPIVEEIFFRGFFYPALRKYLGVGWTILGTAVLFAVVHENIFSFVPIFFLGVVLCYLYEKRSNLLACITLHLVHNTAFITYFFLMKSVFLDS